MMEKRENMKDEGDVSEPWGNEEDESGRSNKNAPENINSSSSGKLRICLATASSMFPGFRFSPTDEELISYYLKKKLEGSDECVELISEVEIWRHEPWDLPAKSVVQSDNEWFFFSPRGRKYPNGSQSKRATESGYWKATGKNRNVKSGSNVIGTKRTLVFHTGRAPEGQRTEWIMHEYCSSEKAPQESMVVCRLRKNKEFHTNDTPKKSRDQCTADNINNNVYSELENAESVREPCTGDSCSNPCITSINSHSVEQIDSGFDYDQAIDIPSSHHLKDPGNEEEDCFVDIMRDDIIKLDDSFNRPLDSLSVNNKKLGPNKNPKQPAQALSRHVLPSQGTANRRLKLRKESIAFFEASYLLKNKKTHAKEFSRSNNKQSSRWAVSARLKRLSIYALLFSLVVVILFLSSLKGSHLAKCVGGRSHL